MHEDAITTPGRECELALRELSELVLESLDLPVEQQVGPLVGGKERQ